MVTVRQLEHAVQQGSLCQLCRFNEVDRRYEPCATCMRDARSNYARTYFTLTEEARDG